MYLTKGAPRALIDAFSAHNRGREERSISPQPKVIKMTLSLMCMEFFTITVWNLR